MSKTVITIHADRRGKNQFFLERGPNHPEAATLYDFTPKPAAKPFNSLNQNILEPNVVKAAGTLLFRNLVKHPAVKAAVDVPITQGTPCPLYLQINSDTAEELPWETLCNPETNGFLTLDKRWPIGRIGDSAVWDEVAERSFEPPLRLTAVLAAAEIDARPEWDALHETIKATQAPVKLQVWVCQEELKEHIESLPNVDAEVRFVPVPEERQDFFQAIQGFVPNILHFFCHGSNEGRPSLEIATRVDWKLNNPRGSIVVEAPQLWQEINPEAHIWLVTLNCCEGAAPSQTAQSIARDLASNGFPAVVGMREAVASDDANLFCRAFYRSVFTELTRVAQAAGKPMEIDWAALLHEPRQRLRDAHAQGRPRAKAEGEAKEWTLPVLYVRRATFRLRGVAGNGALTEAERQSLQVQLDTILRIREFQASMPDLPPGVLAELDTRIARLEEQLFPDPRKNIQKKIDELRAGRAVLASLPTMNQAALAEIDTQIAALEAELTRI